MSETANDNGTCLRLTYDGELEEQTLPIWVRTEEDLYHPFLEKKYFKRRFEFLKTPVRLIVDVYSTVRRKNGSEECLNEYASKITGKDTFGTLIVVFMCSDDLPEEGSPRSLSPATIISMKKFLHMCSYHGKFLREYPRDEKKFPGLSGDMLHRLCLGMAKHKAADGNGAAAGSGAAANYYSYALPIEAVSLSTNRDGSMSVVRRSGRPQKRKVIFDNSHVKKEES